MSPEAHVAFVSDSFSAGRYDRLLDTYVYPLPIYVNRAAAVAHTDKDVWAFFQALHGVLCARGFCRLTGRLTSVEMPRRGRFRTWADWTGAGRAGETLLFRTVCYNQGDLAAHRTEMITIEDIALPDLRQLVQAA